MSKNYYDVLGVDKSCTQEDIKKAYKNLAIKHHPDKNGGDKEAEEKFKEISRAYDEIGTPEKRQQYDDELEGRRPNGFSQGFGNSGGFHTFTMRSRSHSEQLNIMIRVYVNFEDVVSGITKDFRYEKLVKCKVCNGKKTTNDKSVKKCMQCNGQGSVNLGHGMMGLTVDCPSCNGEKVIITDPCKSCNGNGLKEEKAEIKGLKIPKGMNPSGKILCKEKGNQSLKSGGFGDLVVLVEYSPHEIYKLRQNPNNGLLDVILEISVPLHLAILGGVLKIPTLHGVREVKIKSGLKYGALETISKCGLPNLKGSIGDQIVAFDIEMPKNISEELKNELNKIEITENQYPEYNKILKKLKK